MRYHNITKDEEHAEWRWTARRTLGVRLQPSLSGVPESGDMGSEGRTFVRREGKRGALY